VHIDYAKLKEYLEAVKDANNTIKKAKKVMQEYFERCDDGVIPAVVVQRLFENYTGKLTQHMFWKIIVAFGYEKNKRIYAKRLMSDPLKQVYSCPVGDFKIPMRCAVIQGLCWKKELMPEKNITKILF